MYQVILARCANGVVAWGVVGTGQRQYEWVCSRDHFAVPGPASVQDVERVLTAIGQHSVSLAGALQQVVQLAI